VQLLEQGNEIVFPMKQSDCARVSGTSGFGSAPAASEAGEFTRLKVAVLAISH
jgi:hypothetical protein